MRTNVTELIDLYRFPSGRRLFALERVLAVAEERELTELQERVRAALAHDRDTRALELQWSAREVEPRHGPGALVLDAALDRSVSALDDVLAAQIRGFGIEPHPGWANTACFISAWMPAITSDGKRAA